MDSDAYVALMVIGKTLASKYEARCSSAPMPERLSAVVEALRHSDKSRSQDRENSPKPIATDDALGG